jgi:hypothetical protein
MALTWEEQRLLDEMEAVFTAEDPALNAALRGPVKRPAGTRLVWVALAFAVGLAMLVMGNAITIALSAAGLMVITVAAFVATPRPASHTTCPGWQRRSGSGCRGSQ